VPLFWKTRLIVPVSARHRAWDRDGHLPLEAITAFCRVPLRAPTSSGVSGSGNQLAGALPPLGPAGFHRPGSLHGAWSAEYSPGHRR